MFSSLFLRGVRGGALKYNLRLWVQNSDTCGYSKILDSNGEFFVNLRDFFRLSPEFFLLENERIISKFSDNFSFTWPVFSYVCYERTNYRLT